MPTPVLSFVQYIVRTQTRMRDEDHAAHRFVQAVNGTHVSPRTDKIPFPSGEWAMNSSNKSEVFDRFAAWALPSIHDCFSDQPYVLVPIPSSSRTVASQQEDDGPLQLANALSRLSRDRLVVANVLRWRVAPTPSSRGGSRRPDDIYPNLRHVDSTPVYGMPAIVIDDVMTGGGHIKAAKVVLGQHGANVAGAVVVGRTTDTQEDTPFAPVLRYVDDWSPSN